MSVNDDRPLSLVNQQVWFAIRLLGNLASLQRRTRPRSSMTCLVPTCNRPTRSPSRLPDVQFYENLVTICYLGDGPFASASTCDYPRAG